MWKDQKWSLLVRVLLPISLLVVITACGVPREEHEATLATLTETRSDVHAIKNELNALQERNG